jgi:hypothetical protein
MGPKPNKCSCTVHENIVEEEGASTFQVFNLKTGKKVPKYVLDAIVKDGCISPRATYLCSLCMKHFQGKAEPVVKKCKNEDSLVDKVCNALRCDELSAEEVEKLSGHLGNYIARHEK